MMSIAPLCLPAPGDDLIKSLSSFPVFRDLSEPVLEMICENAEVRTYAPGQTVYAMGQFDGSEFLAVVSGRMKASVMEADTGAVLIEHVGAGSLFAVELAFRGIDEDAYQALSVSADENLTVVAIETEAFRTVAGQRPSLTRKIALYFANELAGRRFKNMTAEAPPEQRVYALLAQHIERDQVAGEWRIAQMPKHRELAEKAGVDEALAASAVATLIQEGIAKREYPGLIIEEMSKFNELSGFG